MTAARRRRLLAQGRALGFTGSNLGQLSAVARSVASGNTAGATGGQRRTARAVASALSGSA